MMLGDGFYGALREGIRYFGSGPGEGSNVNINLGKPVSSYKDYEEV
mgnify:CR=1 FL=1